MLVNYKDLYIEKNLSIEFQSDNIISNNKISNNPELNNFSNRKTLINMSRDATDFNISLIDFNASKLIKLFATKMDHVSIR